MHVLSQWVCLQAREWDDADLADAELLKAAWPRLR
jgi:hypothetical protein